MASNVRPGGNSVTVPLISDEVKSGDVVRCGDIVGIAQIDAFQGRDGGWYTELAIEGVANAITPQGLDFPIGEPAYVGAAGTPGGVVSVEPSGDKVAGLVTAIDQLDDGTQRVWFKLTPGVDGAGGGGGGTDIDWANINEPNVNLTSENAEGSRANLDMSPDGIVLNSNYGAHLYVDPYGITLSTSNGKPIAIQSGGQGASINFTTIGGPNEPVTSLTLKDIRDGLINTWDVTPGTFLQAGFDGAWGWVEITIDSVEGLQDALDSLENRSVDWVKITGKPLAYNPQPHEHSISEVEGLQAIIDDLTARIEALEG